MKILYYKLQAFHTLPSIIDNNFLAIETLLAECHVQSVRVSTTM